MVRRLILLSEQDEIILKNSGISRLHATWLSPTELAQITGLSVEEAEALKERVRVFISLTPLRCSWGIEVLDTILPLIYGAHLLMGDVERFVKKIEPEVLWVPELLDEQYVNYLVYDLPKEIEENIENRRPVATYVEAFTRDIEEGVRYALWTLHRIGVVYRIPVLALGSPLGLKFKEYLTGAVEFVKTVAGTEVRVFLPSPNFALLK